MVSLCICGEARAPQTVRLGASDSAPHATCCKPLSNDHQSIGADNSLRSDWRAYCTLSRSRRQWPHRPVSRKSSSGENATRTFWTSGTMRPPRNAQEHACRGPRLEALAPKYPEAVSHSPLLLDNVLEGLNHAGRVLRRVELLARLEHIEGVEHLHVRQVAARPKALAGSLSGAVAGRSGLRGSWHPWGTGYVTTRGPATGSNHRLTSSAGCTRTTKSSH